MLYSLGYSIPNTKKIRFNRCEVRAVIKCGSFEDVSLFRYSDDFIEVAIDGATQTFALPGQLDELHGKLFGTQNFDILHNLLGAFYVDQEKGWTLLNRGVVIGSIHFNIEELIRGLSGRDCSELIQMGAKLSRDIAKYRQMFSIAQYSETVQAESGSVAIEQYEDRINADISKLMIEEQQLKRELRRVDQTLSDNRRFKKFVAEMKLLVQGPNETIIQVTADNIVGLNDAIELLVAKRKMIASQLSIVSARLAEMQKQQHSETDQLAFFRPESMTDIFDRQVISMQLNPIAIKKELNRLEKELKEVRKEITEMTKYNNTIVSDLYHNMVKYAGELGIGNSESIAMNYLFTSNLKELSGAILRKTVFAFRLAYIIAIENALDIKLPIILDSPSGKEVDQANVRLMTGILNRDFSNHQVIIASIFEYDFDEINRIEIQDKLIP